VRILSVWLICCCLLSCVKNQPQTACMPVIASYPTWNANKLAVENIPWQKFNQLAIMFVLPNADGSLQTADVDKIIQPLVEQAHSKHKKVVISVGGALGYADAFQKIAADEKALKNFAVNLSQYVERHKIDGVDIDWEYWTKQAVHQQGGNDPAESKLLVKLLAAVRAELPDHIQLSTDIFAGNWYGEQYLPEIENHVDYVVLMAYDFTGAWDSSPVAHHADYDTFKKSIDFVLGRGFSKNKLILGFPAYGIEFIDGKNKQVNKDYSHQHILEKLKQNGVDINKGKLGNLYFETPDLVRKKSQYLINQQLAGIMMFELTQDSLADSTSLLSASNHIIQPDFCQQSTKPQN
jgi:chitinase